MDRVAGFITDFGDAGVVTPLCAAVALMLLLLGARRAASVWVAVTVAVWGIMLLLKLGGYAAEGLATRLSLPELGLVTPSGHAAAAAAAYGGLVALCCKSPVRAAATALGVALLVGFTRVALGDHTPAEVVVGGVVGVAGALALASWPTHRLTGRRRLALLGVAATVMVVFHGSHVTWEHTIRETSAYAVRELLPPSL